jgi:hypothetical protein
VLLHLVPSARQHECREVLEIEKQSRLLLQATCTYRSVLMRILHKSQLLT